MQARSQPESESGGHQAPRRCAAARPARSSGSPPGSREVRCSGTNEVTARCSHPEPSESRTAGVDYEYSLSRRVANSHDATHRAVRCMRR